ncbi:MAG: hypothetical protein A4E32_00660 [Methanomassiliicoccales archaeon PtaU1.Bin124]|nr:MAG: hypothetical protein A4E32_00660 [Methanomassiliicoccales archaeon PtaU1.Bin124]
MLSVTARTPLYPTEDASKVMRALLFLFPNGEVEESSDMLELRTDDMAAFMENIRRSRILDAIRSALRQGMDGNRTVFLLNKQVACAGRISLTEGKVPLGSIEVTIESEDIEKAIDRIAPMTVNGEEVQ